MISWSCLCSSGRLLVLVLVALALSEANGQTPSVTMIEPRAGHNLPGTYSGYVTISGLNFGTASTPTVSFVSTSGTACPSTSWTSGTTVQCQLRSSSRLADYYKTGDVSSGNYLVVKTAGGDGNLAFTFDAPAVSHHSGIINAPTTGGTSLTVQGSSFWLYNSSPTAYLGGTECASTKWISTTQAVCQIRSVANIANYGAASDTAGPRVTVRVRAVVGTSSQSGFTFDAPVLTAAHPYYNLAPSGGISVTLSGFNFGSAYESATVVLHPDTHGSGLSCSSQWVSATSIKCRANPALPLASKAAVVVTVAAVVGTRLQGFSYNAPVISTHHPLESNSPVTGGASTSIFGLNFAANDFTLTASLGDNNCATSGWTTSTTVTCFTGNSVSAGVKATSLLTVSGIVGTRGNSFTFDAPSVSGALNLNVAQSAVTSVTISGLNFGYIAPTLTMELDSTQGSCSTTAWTSATTASCSGNINYRTSLASALTIATSIGTGSSILFSFDAPVASYAIVGAGPNAPMTGGLSVTLTGLNFHGLHMSPTIAFGNNAAGSKACKSSTWASATTIHCLAPATSSTSYQPQLAVSVMAIVGTSTNLKFSFDSPVLSTANQGNAALSGNSMLSLIGLNFAMTDNTPTGSVDSATGNIAACLTAAWTSNSIVKCAAPSHLYGLGKTSAVTVSAVVGTRMNAITYDSPAMSFVAGTNVATSGASTITIQGLNFGTTVISATAGIEDDLCTTTSWTTGTTVTCASGVAAYGVGPNQHLILTVAASVGTRKRVMTFDAPVASGLLKHSNFITTAGAMVTISGLNFGYNSKTPTLLLADDQTLFGTTSWTSATTVQAQTFDATLYKGSTNQRLVQAYYPVTGTLVNTMSGTSLSVFSFDAPTVSFLDAANTATSGDAITTVTGFNFGKYLTSPTIRLGSSLCTSSSWVSATQLKCMLSTLPVYGTDHAVHVTISAVVGTAQNRFSFDSPVLSFVSPNSPGTGGASLSMIGMNFVTSDLSPTAAIGASNCQTTSWSTNTRIMCLSPPGILSAKSPVVTVSAVVGTRQLAAGFTFNAPIISSVREYNMPASGINTITLRGLEFGHGVVTPTVGVAEDQQLCTTTSWSTNTLVKCAAAGLALTADSSFKRSLVVTVATLATTKMTFFSFDSAVVSATVGTSNAVTSGGTSVTISGLNFGGYSRTPTSKIGTSDDCATTSWSSVSTVSCSSAIGVGPSKVQVMQGLTGTSNSMFTFDAPVVSYFQDNAPVTGSASLTLHGLNFASADYTPSTQLGLTMCATVAWNTATQLRCSQPGAYGRALTATYMKLTVAAIVGTSAHTVFSFDAPILSGLSNDNLPICSGMTTSISGVNFGVSNLTPSVSITPSMQCQTSIWTSTSSILCSVPAELAVAGAKLSSIVTVSAVVGTRGKSFSWDAPVVSFETAANIARTTMTLVTISGMNFVEVDLTPTAHLTDDYLVGTAGMMTSTSWTSPTSIYVLTNTQSGAQGGLGLSTAVTVSAVVGTRVQRWSYDSPILSGASQANAAASGGTSVTISGLNFGYSSLTPTAQITEEVCTTSSWSSSTTVSCAASGNTAGGYVGPNRRLGVTISSLVGSVNNIFSFDAPTVSHNFKDNMASSIGMSVTISGLNFGAQDYTASIRAKLTECRTVSWTSGTTMQCQMHQYQHGSGLGFSYMLSVSTAVGTAVDVFTFDAPVASFSVPNYSPSGAASITIEGLNFGNRDLTGTVRLGSTLCSTVSWNSVTALSCYALNVMGHGSGLKRSALVTIAAMVGTKQQTFTFDTPVLSFLNAYNQPTSAGESVTVMGMNFGSLNFSPSVQISQTQCSTSEWVSTTSVKCLLPVGTGAQRTPTLTVSAVVGTLRQKFSYDSPVVTRADNYNGGMTGGASVTLRGLNFGMMDATLTGALDHGSTQICATTSWTTQSMVLCATSKYWYGSARNRPIALTVSASVGTRAARGSFTWDAPVLSGTFRSNTAASGGVSVTITGLNFGSPVAGSNFGVTPTAIFGDGECSTTAWTSTSTVNCGPAPSGSGNSLIRMAVASITGTSVSFFSFDAPVVSFLQGAENAAKSGGSYISLAGVNFANKDVSPTGMMASTYCATTTWTTTTTIRCRYGAQSQLTPTAAALAVTVSAVVGTAGYSVFSFDAPVLSSSSADNWPTCSSAYLTLAGVNFGTGDTTPTAVIHAGSSGENVCGTSVWTAHTAIRCDPPTGDVGASKSLIVTVSAVVGTRMKTFSWDAPVVSFQFAALNSPQSSGVEVTMNGINFGSQNFTPTSSFNTGQTDFICGTTQWMTTTSVSCESGSGYGAALNAIVTVSTSVGTNMAVFTYDSPAISQAISANAPTSTSYSVTISGLNFFDSLDLTPTASLEEADCETTAWTSSTTVGCLMGGSPIMGSNIGKLTVAGIVGCGQNVFTFDTPTVSHQINGNTPTCGSGSVTITGLNFASVDATPSSRLGLSTCATVSWNSGTTLKCAAPAGARSVSAIVTVSQMSGTDLFSFTFDSPVVSYGMQYNMATSDGTSITVQGLNFNGVDGISPTVAIGRSRCLTTSWVSSTALYCKQDGGASGSRTVAVTIAAIVGTRLNTFSFDSPIISQTKNVNTPTTVGGYITMLGSNFAMENTTPTAMLGDSMCTTAAWSTLTSVSCMTTDSGTATKITTMLTVSAMVGTRVSKFTYDAPVLTGAAGYQNSAASGSASVTISGLNFGYASATPTAALDETACLTTAWTSLSTVSCASPSSSGIGIPVLSVSTIVGTSTIQFSWDAPTVSFALTEKNVPLSGGLSVTISGLNFGGRNYTPSAQIGPSDCATTSWNSATTLSCTPKNPSGTGHKLAAIVSSVAGTLVGLFTFDAPVLSNIDNSNAAASVGLSVTLQGVNFGAYDASSSVKLGSSACGTTSWTSDSSLKCLISDGGAGGLINQFVTISAVVGTVQKTFSFDAPVLSDATGSSIGWMNSATSGGSSVTLVGTNFGYGTDLTPTGILGDLNCGTSSWHTSTKVLCSSPANVGVKISSVITVSAVVGTRTMTFSYDAPIMTQSSHANSPTSGGGTVTLRGINFGSNDYTPTAGFIDGECSTTSWSSISKILCLLPDTSSGRARSITTTVSTIVGTSAALFSFDGPAISHTSSNNPNSGALSVTISGLNFGSYSASPTAMIGSTACDTTSWSSATTLQCGASMPGSGTKTVRVEVTSVFGTVIDSFTFDAPAVSFNDADNFPQSGGSTVTLFGTNFVTTGSTPSIRLGLTQCATQSWTTNTLVKCYSNPGAGLKSGATVSIAAVVGTLNFVFSFDSPVISSILEVNGATSGGTSLTLSGASFAATGLSQSVRLGNSMCSTTAWISDTQIVCRSPTGYGNGAQGQPYASPGALHLTVAAVVGTKELLFSFDAPVLTHVALANSAASGAAGTTILGINFGADDFTLTARVGGSLEDCLTTSWTSTTALLCTIPAASPSAHYASAVVAGDFHTTTFGTHGTFTSAFTYDSPVLTDVAPRNIPLSTGSSVTVLGLNFGTGKVTPTSVLDVSQCTTTSWTSGTNVRCYASVVGEHSRKHVSLTVGALAGSVLSLITYDAPVSSFAAPRNAVSSGGTSLTLFGASFGQIDFTASAQVGTAPCQTTSWNSQTYLSCLGPVSFGRAIAVSLTVSATVGTVEKMVTFDAPVVTDGSPSNSPSTGGSTLTVSGLNFAMSNLTPSMQVGSTSCASASWYSSTVIRCRSAVGGPTVSMTAAVTISSIVSTKMAMFSFDSPVFSAFLANSNGPTTGGFGVTLTGQNFATSDLSPSVTLDTYACSTTSWLTNSAIMCVQPSTALYANYGTSKPVVLTVSANVGTKREMFTYDSPVISMDSPPNSATSGSASVSVFGLNFSPLKDVSATAKIASSLCQTTSWTTSTAVTCQTPEGQKLPLDTLVTIGKLVGTARLLFTYDTPIVSDLIVENTPATGASSVTVAGINFGTYASSATTSIGSTNCATATWTTQSTIRCLTPAGLEPSSQVAVLLSTAVGTTLSIFTYDSPVVSSADAPNGPTIPEATKVSVSGVNFGLSSATPSVRIGSSACETTVWSTDSSVICALPSGVGKEATIIATLSSLVGTKLGAFTFDSPAITSLARPNGPTSAGFSLTVMGTNFGSSDATPTTAVASTVCGTTSWTTVTSILCKPTIPGSGASVSAVLTIQSVVGTTLDMFSYDAPTLTQLDTANTPESGSAYITLRGFNFGPTSMSATTRVGATLCNTMSWNTNTQVTCATGAGSGTELTVQLTLSAIQSTQLAMFSYDAPVVSFQSPSNGATSGDGMLTVHGNNFAFFDQTPSFRLGATLCGTVSWTTSSSATCATPAGHGTVSYLRMQVLSVVSTDFSSFTYDSPTLSQTAAFNAPTTGGTLITLFGNNFAKVSTSATARIGGTLCESTIWSSVTAIVCVGPVGYGGSHTTALTLSGLSGTKLLGFTFDGPAVTDILAPNLPTSARGELTVLGLNFAGSDLSQTVRMGSTTCGTTSWSSATALMCFSDPSIGRSIDVVVSVGTATGTMLDMFTYDSPVLSVVDTPNGPTSGGVSVTLHGFNFGTENASPSAVISSTLCGTSSWVTESAVYCLSSSYGSSTEHDVGLTVSSLLGTILNAFTYDAPSVTYGTRNMPTSAGGTVTMSGFNFASTDLSVSASIGPSFCATTSWVTNTAIHCLASQGYGTTVGSNLYTAVAYVNQLLGTESQVFTYDSPILSAIRPRNGATTAALSVTVAGVNFANTDTTISIQISSFPCATSSWSSNTAVACAIGAGYGARTEVSLTVASLLGTQLSSFTFDAPMVSYTAPTNTPTTSGASISLMGQNFGTLDPTMSVTIAGTVCDTTSWTSVSSISCTAPNGTGGGKRVAITLSQSVGTAISLFSYNAPVVSRTQVPNAPASGGASVTLVGTNFGVENTSMTATLGETPCTTASWISQTYLSCHAAQYGVGTRRRVVVTLSGLLGTTEDLFTYDTPVMTYINPGNMAQTSTLSITVMGFNMGNVDPTPSVQVGTTLCATTSWSTSTAVSCTAQSGAGAARRVNMEVGKNIGTAYPAFSYDSPVISHTFGVNSPSSGGLSITLMGVNFGSVDLTLSAKIGSTDCTTATWMSSTRVTCAMDPGFGMALASNVMLMSSVGTQFAVFSFDAPVATVSGINGPSTTGAVITFSGNNFGLSDPTPSGQVGIATCSTSIWTSGTSVTCRTPVNSGAGLHTTVIIGSTIGTVTQVFTYDAAVITDLVEPNAPTTGEASITVLGLNFGGTDISSSILVGESACSTSSWVSATSLSCQSVMGAGLSKMTGVTITGIVGTFEGSFSYDAPVSSSLAPPNSALSTTASLTLTGFNFENSNNSPTITIGGSACATASWNTGTSISCLYAVKGSGGGYSKVLTLSDVFMTKDSAFTFDAPAVTQAAYASSPNIGNAALTLFGFNMGYNDYTPTVRLGLTTCGTSSWTSHTAMMCVSQVGAGSALSVAVSVSKLSGTIRHAYTYDAPEITETSDLNGPTSGGVQLTVFGVNFGLTDVTATVQVGTQACSKTEWTSITKLTCITPPGSGQDRRAVVTISKQVGTIAKAFTFDSPVVTKVARSNAPTTGSAVLTVLGTNFGMIDHTPTAFIGSTACQTSVWSSQTSILCTAAIGSAVAASTRVVLTGVIGTTDEVFTYDAPTVTAHYPPNAPLSAGATVTVQGFNFGYSDLSPTLKLASSSCTSADWISDTAILCGVPAGAGTGFTTSVLFTGQSGSGLGFTFDAPVLTALSLANTPTSAGSTTTVWGTNFGISNLNPDVNVAGVSCSKSEWISTTAAICTPGAGSGKDLTVGLVARQLAGSLATVFSYDAPAVTQVYLGNGPTAGASVATVLGTNFGAAGAPVAASIGANGCASSSFITTTSLVCITSTGMGIQKAVAVTSSGLVGELAGGYTFDSPKINEVLPPNSATSGGASLTVLGQNFGATGTSPTVIIGVSSCGTALWQSDSSVLCGMTKAGIGGSNAVAVNVGNLTGAGDGLFSYDSPIVQGIVQGNSPTTGGQIVTVVGFNFGTVNSSPSGFIGLTACSSNTWISDSSFTCITPEGSGVTAVSSLVSSQNGATNNLFSYDGPVITHLSAFNGPAAGGFPVTLNGMNLGTSDYTGEFSIGAGIGDSTTLCLRSNAWISSTTLVCGFGAANTGIDMRFHVDINKQVGTGAPVFSYDSPVLTVVSPANGPTTGGASITIKGTNFGARRPYNDHQGQIGDASQMLPCSTVMWLTNNVVVCSSSPGQGSSGTIAIGPTPEVNAGTLMNAFSFDAPVVTYLALSNAPTVGGSMMTITGMNLGTASSSTNQVDIAVAGNKCSSTSFISSSAVTCVTPAGIGTALDVQVNINSQPGMLYGLFSYDARFVSPPTGTEFVITVGEIANVFLIAKGEDFASQIALSSFTGANAEHFAGYPATLTKLETNSKDPSASFTWAPAEAGSWNACFQLINSDGIAVDTTCVTIRTIFCQHQVVPGETTQMIADKYQVEWRTIFLLNPAMTNLYDVQPGQILNIGKGYTLAPGQTLEYLVNELGTTWYQLALANPRKVTPGLAGASYDPNWSVSGVTVQPAAYKTSTSFAGLTYCVVTTDVN